MNKYVHVDCFCELQKLDAQVEELAYKTSIKQKKELKSLAPVQYSIDVRSCDTKSHDSTPPSEPIPITTTEEFEVPPVVLGPDNSIVINVQSNHKEALIEREVQEKEKPLPSKIETDVVETNSNDISRDDVVHEQASDEDDLTEISEDTMFEDSTLQSEEG